LLASLLKSYFAIDYLFIALRSISIYCPIYLFNYSLRLNFGEFSRGTEISV